MNCKNCGNSLRTDYSYCPDCGAKVIRNRITFKNLWYDIVERYFNLDNTFLKTFTHLLTKPQVVIEGYLSGIRRKYLNPISYMAIALTLSGITLFIMRKYAWDKINFSDMDKNVNQEAFQKIMEASLDYSSFIFLLYIPITAFAGYLVFNRKKYFLSEHLVANMYSLANFSIISFFISSIWLLVNPSNYFKISFGTIVFMMLYTLYVYIRMNGTSIANSFLRAIGYILLFTIGFFGISILLNILFVLFGIIDLQDLLPKKA